MKFEILGQSEVRPVHPGERRPPSKDQSPGVGAHVCKQMIEDVVTFDVVLLYAQGRRATPDLGIIDHVRRVLSSLSSGMFTRISQRVSCSPSLARFGSSGT